MTFRSTYTHSPVTGQRIDQYARPIDPIAPDQGNLVRSGYRHYRSTIQAGQSADNLHIVNEWGRPVAPYEHWRFPFRPYGVPYQAWGPPTPGVLSNLYAGNVYGGYGVGQPTPGQPQPFPAQPFPAQPFPAQPYPMQPHPGQPFNPYATGQAYPLVPPYQPAPWNDGFYPSAPPLGNP